MAFLCTTLICILLPILGVSSVATDIQTQTTIAPDIQKQTTTCLQKIIPGADVEVLTASPLPNWEIHTFKLICGKKSIFDGCMKKIPKNPDEPSLEIIKTLLEKKIDFLCGSGRDYYIHHKTCLAKNDVQRKVQTCSDYFGKEDDHNCTVINEFRDCVRNASVICGSEAKFLVTRYMDFNVEPFTGTPDCGDPFSAGTTNRFGLLNLMLPVVTVWIKLF